jgi:hypothetical protein
MKCTINSEMFQMQALYKPRLPRIFWETRGTDSMKEIHIKRKGVSLFKDVTPQSCVTSSEASTLNTVDATGTFTINLILQSAFQNVPNTSLDYHPLSLLVLGKAGTGKSRLLMTMHTLKKKYLDFVSYTDDITPKFLVEFLKKAEKGEKCFLVIPDFQVITHSHGRKTYGTTISILRQMISDGVGNLDDYGLEFHPEFLVRAGLITATTIASYSQFAERWKKDGFLSRLIPYSFIHSKETVDKILRNIALQKTDSLEDFRYVIHRNPQLIKCDSPLLLQLRGYAEPLGERTEALPYRSMNQLISLVKMTAIIKGDSQIKQQHVDTVIKLLSYINYDFNAI